MTSKEWTLVKSVFSRAQEIEHSARDRWLGDQGTLPPTVLAEVRRLIEASTKSDGILEAAAPASAPLGSPVLELLPEGEILLNRFKVESHLGSGAMGDVYSAFDCELGTTIAFKTLRKHLAKLSELVLSLRREVLHARRVRHPNVCQIFDLHQDLGHVDGPLLFFTMELLTGETLAARIAEGIFDLDFALEIARGLALGLEAIHTAGLVHRDLKPSNVFLLRPSGPGPIRTVITDFGLCLDQDRPVTETLTHFGPQAVIGTPAYMAPEQLLGQGAAPSSDVYAFGVILFEMVTGRRPFDGETPLAVALRRLKDRAPSPREFRANLTVQWEQVILSCLQYDSTKRPASPTAVIAALARKRSTVERVILDRRQFWISGLGAAGVVAITKYLPKHHKPDSRAEYHLKLGLEFSHQSSIEGIRNAILEMKQAVAIDPLYADGWANLADIYCMASTFSAMRSREARQLAEDAARRALSLDSSIGLAHAAYAYALSANLKQWRSAEPYFKRAILLNPSNTSARSWYAGFLGRMSRFKEAVPMAESALQLDPGSFRLNQRLGSELSRAKLYDRCLSHMLAVVRLHPAQASGFCLLGRAYEWLKRFAEAEAALQHAEELPDKVVTTTYWATLLAARGFTVDAMRLADEIFADWRAEAAETNALLMALGSLAMALGQHSQSDQIVSVLQEGIRREDETVLAAASEPYMQVMKTDPRVVSLLKQLNLV